MRGLNQNETNEVGGGFPSSPSPSPGISQWEWEQLLRLIEEQNRRNGHQQQN